MFGGFQPPQATAEEIRAAEAEAAFTIQRVVAAAAVLYLSPFVVDAVSKMF
ncbi:mitochondrial outer membrane translocase complex, subunit Tom5 [Staphylotrichum tortipilum]|uniref:Mitochondrial outer membrane translocase complex, subunit Tom5 n=1 Tax=Staphylotrichum tortipilum TaxID=2831512 RepID=A0AAN6MPI3_9PEZI|nr:mitochondrial outer membrane translocase complex, subunit Tom5 [Staphylotrichum longicolle]